MQIILAAVEPELATAWRIECRDLSMGTIHEGSILDLEVDAVVSPANSFGFMDGGIDLAYTMRFGPQLQGRLQDRIVRRHHGELPVGNAEILETFDARIPYLIASPTMRVPMRLVASANPYLATRAALLLVLHGTFADGDEDGRPVRDVVRRVAFPGMGTGIGAVPPAVCARQMRAAIDACLNRTPFPPSIHDASDDHEALLR